MVVNEITEYRGIKTSKWTNLKLTFLTLERNITLSKDNVHCETASLTSGKTARS